VSTPSQLGRAGRPAQPRPSATPWLALGGVLAITVWASLASTGIGVDLSELARNGSNATRVLSQLVDPHRAYWRTRSDRSSRRSRWLSRRPPSER